MLSLDMPVTKKVGISLYDNGCASFFVKVLFFLLYILGFLNSAYTQNDYIFLVNWILCHSDPQYAQYFFVF